MKKSVILSLTLIVMFTLVISPVSAKLSETESAELRFDLSNCEVDLEGDTGGDVDGCALPFLKKISEYHGLSEKGKELLKLYRAWKVYQGEAKKKEVECIDGCNREFDNCGEKFESDISLPRQEDPYYMCLDKYGVACSQKCWDDFKTLKYGDYNPTSPYILESTKLYDFFMVAVSEYGALLGRYGAEDEAPVVEETKGDSVVPESENFVDEVWVTGSDGKKYKAYPESNVGGPATIKFPDGHKVIVAKNSKVVIGQKNQMTLIFGRIRAQIKKLKKIHTNQFTVKTPKGYAFIRGTEFVMEYDKGTETVTLHLYEGEIEITTEARSDVISAGKTITFDETGITSETELTEENWQLAVENLRIISPNWVMLSIAFLVLFAIVGLTAFFIKKFAKPETKGWGITGVIFGIFSIFLAITAIYGLPFSIGAIWFSLIQKKHNPTMVATAGLILGILGTIFGLLITIISLI